MNLFSAVPSQAGRKRKIRNRRWALIIAEICRRIRLDQILRQCSQSRNSPENKEWRFAIVSTNSAFPELAIQIAAPWGTHLPQKEFSQNQLPIRFPNSGDQSPSSPLSFPACHRLPRAPHRLWRDLLCSDRLPAWDRRSAPYRQPDAPAFWR